LPKYKSGFRPNHSTLTALVEATNSWCVNIDNGLLNGVVFIDLKKAFETIDQNILLNSFLSQASLVDRERSMGYKFHFFGSVHAMKTEIPPFDSEIKDSTNSSL
jgi:hypothetical protein